MQKGKYLRNKKWALQDAIHLLSQGVDVSLNIGWQRPAREIITTMNRDRPGGHQPVKYRLWSKMDRREARREQKKITKAALTQWLNDEADDRHEEWTKYLDDEWYDDTPMDYVDPWDGYDDLHWDDWRDYDYGPYNDYDCGSSYSLTHQNAEWKIEGILINLLDGTIRLSDAKKQIMDLL